MANLQINSVLGSNFVLKKKLGSGAFGDIYLALNLRNNIEVAVKVQPLDN